MRSPPTNVSSTSTGPWNGGLSASSALLIRCATCHADFCVMPRARLSWRLDTPFGCVMIAWIAMAHTWQPSRESSMTEPVLTEKNGLVGQSRQRCVMVG